MTLQDREKHRKQSYTLRKKRKYKRSAVILFTVLLLCMLCGCSFPNANMESIGSAFAKGSAWIESLLSSLGEDTDVSAGAENADGSKDTSGENNAENGANAEKGESAGAQSDTGTVAVDQTQFADCYAYGTLSAEEQVAYAQILDCIEAYEETATLSTKDKEVIDKAFDAVLADHGGLFWVSGYVYRTYTNTNTGEILYIEFEPDYTMTQAERDSYQKSIDASAAQMLSGLPAQGDDYEKVKYLYETLIENVEYDKSAEQNQNIISVFVYRATVCQGYACAMQYLLEQIGIPCVIVTGTSNGENHAWNMVMLDGDYYYVDTTWGNSTFANESETGKYVNYSYLNVTTEQLHRTHQETVSFSLPTCTATADNYFVREGLFFDTWNPDAIGALYRSSWEGERTSVSVRFADEALYRQAKEYFLDEQKIVVYCPGITSLSYVEDEKQYVLRVSF